MSESDANPQASRSPSHTQTTAPWLIAAWPGMGNVAVIAAGYLVRQLGLDATGELASHEHFDITEIAVKSGLVLPVRLPRGLFFRKPPGHRKKGGGARELIVFLGEAQPTSDVLAYAHELLAAAKEMGAERVVTFASMASALHPASNPKVAGIATGPEGLLELRRAEVEPMEDGQIAGLNGVVLAAAAEHGMTGLCLLAEVPYFAASVPNPKAARAALSVFSILAGVDVSLDELNVHADAVDRLLIDLLEKLKAQGEGGLEGVAQKIAPESEVPATDESDADEKPPTPTPTDAAPEPKPPPVLDLVARQRIEQLFEGARKDASKAVTLKQELDRLGVFERYEDRFLDLFRRGG